MTPEPEHVVTFFEVSATPKIMIGVTSKGSVLIGEPALSMEEPVTWHHRIVDGAGIAELQQLLEQAMADRHRILRKLYPSELRLAIRGELEAGPRSLSDLIGCISEPGEVSRELRRMATDGEVRPKAATGAAIRLWELA